MRFLEIAGLQPGREIGHTQNHTHLVLSIVHCYFLTFLFEISLCKKNIVSTEASFTANVVNYHGILKTFN